MAELKDNKAVMWITAIFVPFVTVLLFNDMDFNKCLVPLIITFVLWFFTWIGGIICAIIFCKPALL
jgi:general stress protein CsbA